MPLIQACLDIIDHTNGGTLTLLPRIYYLNFPVFLNHQNSSERSLLTLQTDGITPSHPGCTQVGSPACAIFKASSTFQAGSDTDTTGGLLIGNNLKNLTLDHIVIDGNRGARI